MFQDISCARGARPTPTTSRRINRYRLFKRANSVFNNSEFAAEGLPSPGELKLLEPFRARAAAGGVRPAVRRAAHRRRSERAAPQPAEGARAARGRGLEARRRRQAAQRQGRTVRVRVPDRRAKRSTRMTDWQRNLEKLGITLQGAQRRLRAVPAPARGIRLRHGHDRRAATSRCRRSPTTSTSYGSKAADEKGNNNFRGVKSAAVDHLLEAMASAHHAGRVARRLPRARPRRDVELLAGARAVLRRRDACRTGTSSACPRCAPRYFTIDSADVDRSSPGRSRPGGSRTPAQR